MNSGKVVLSALVGAAAGVTIGVLFAPDKGTNTRKKIAKKKDDYVDGLKDKLHGYVDVMSHKLDAAKTEAGNLIEQGKAKALEVKNEITGASVDGKHTPPSLPHQHYTHSK